MSQSRRQSFMEAATNVSVGLILAVAVQAFTFPLLGITAGAWQMTSVSLIFTAVSLLRSYALRRLFEHLNDGE